jgi:hypothetical protein
VIARLGLERQPIVLRQILWGPQNKEYLWLRESWDTVLQSLGGREPREAVKKRERV